VTADSSTSTTHMTPAEPSRVGADPVREGSAPGVAGPAAWRVAGGLGIAHVVLIFAGLSLQSVALFDEGRDGVAALAQGNLPLTVLGGYIDLLGFVLLLPVMVFLARTIGGSATGRWAAQTALAAGIAYVALTFSPGLAAGATAIQGIHNEADVDAAWLMNNLRVITYVVSLVLLGVHAIGVAVAARADRFSPRWVGIGGLGVGAALMSAPLLLASGMHDVATLLWTLWWVGLSVQLLRRASH
jgi:hypothetical protein